MAKKTTTRPSARRGLSIHIGLNSVSPAHYEGWSGDLAACEFDAKDMAAIAKAAGMKPKVLLTRSATRKRVLAALRAAATQLRSGDLLFLTFSGHGGQIPDVTAEEQDKLDETWCFFDAQLIDDELYLELTRFRKGVRILVLSDSCHSGTVTRARLVTSPADARRSKMLPPPVATRTYARHQAFYDGLQKTVEKSSKAAASVDPDAALAHVTVSGRLTDISRVCKAAVILISGCQDNQTSMDGDRNGAFTEQLLRVWNEGAFTGNYARFHAAIRAALPRSQSPNLFTLGPATPFAAQRPFTV